ncbi:sugar nucleotide-binding protein [Calycomorphotria hydatis]|uniref:dTDP-4-dehydrorhamnose reductase n=1 Tax=Calycomorphotria hydatis TaxID=2528027 RepID=A0A517T7A5_9PLAN|nr:sugar nucleotide-binding protein [Calycomorphotria hydatis]QDT64230.1 RmlD substrate binding domain protein [Calycomorphotria hydatis]
MDSILILGSETTTGSNIASRLSEQNTVTALPVTAIASQSEPVATAGPRNAMEAGDIEAARTILNNVNPSRVIYCGAASESCWSKPQIGRNDLSLLRVWLRAVREHGSALTLVSSDGVFAGPHMFHDESSDRFCESLEATIIRDMEELVLRVVPDSLVVRTNAFGWSKEDNGWIERELAQLEQAVPYTFENMPYASPILATDLAEAIERTHEEELKGLLHLAGAERVSKAEFLQTLASVFELPAPEFTPIEIGNGPATGFGAAETALNSKKARNLLNFALPTLMESMIKLKDQHTTITKPTTVTESIAA